MNAEKAQALALKIQEDKRITTTLIGKKSKHGVRLELKKHGLVHEIHSIKEWQSIKQAWSLFE